MGLFTLSRSNVAFNTANDFLTIIGAASRQYDVVQLIIGGMGTASAAGEMGVYRSTVGTTPSGSITAVPVQTNQVAAGFTNATAWVAQPTLGNRFAGIPVNNNGGLAIWSPKAAGIKISSVGVEQLSFRPLVGSGSYSFMLTLEEF